MEKFNRTNYCGEITINDLNKNVSVIGWVSKFRNHGGIMFIDLRDRTGIVQILVNNDEVKIDDIGNEYIFEVSGVVSKRATANPNLKTGEIEIIASNVKLINTACQPPIYIKEDSNASEDIRLKYRYLDLRRHCMLEKFLTRSKIINITNEYFSSMDLFMLKLHIYLHQLLKAQEII